MRPWLLAPGALGPPSHTISSTAWLFRLWGSFSKQKCLSWDEEELLHLSASRTEIWFFLVDVQSVPLVHSSAVHQSNVPCSPIPAPPTTPWGDEAALWGRDEWLYPAGAGAGLLGAGFLGRGGGRGDGRLRATERREGHSRRGGGNGMSKGAAVAGRAGLTRRALACPRSGCTAWTCGAPTRPRARRSCASP